MCDAFDPDDPNKVCQLPSGEVANEDSLRADLASARKLVAEMAAEVARLREVARSGWECARLLSIGLDARICLACFRGLDPFGNLPASIRARIGKEGT